MRASLHNPCLGFSEQITFYFTEFNATAAGQRVMDLQINSQTVTTGIDVYALAGSQDTAVSVAIPFNSGSRSNFDIVLATSVRFVLLVACGRLGAFRSL